MKPKIELHNIKIKVVLRRGGGWGIKVHPDHQQAHWQDEIQWLFDPPMENALFVVHFGPYGPMEEVSYNSRRPKGTVKYKAPNYACTFKYFVGVCNKDEVKILDPELEILP